MQLHPKAPGGSARHAAESLSAGFVGLDSDWDVGDLCRAKYDDLPSEEKNQWAFAYEMVEGDHVLIFCHHSVCSGKNSGTVQLHKESSAGNRCVVRHFRRVDSVRCYGDFKTNVAGWKPLTMTSTLTPLRKSESGSQQLIDEWIAST